MGPHILQTFKDFLARRKEKKNFRLELPSSDFIPASCHIDDKTILTKDGHLIQIIKVVGLVDQADGKVLDIREAVREALQKHINDTKFAIWLHTIRTRSNIDPSGKFNNKISKFIHSKWVEKNYWNDKFINEIYISIVYQGIDLKVKDINSLVDMLSFDSLRNRHSAYIKEAHAILSEAVNNIANDLKNCGAKILTIFTDKDNTVRSEPIEFFSKVINLKQQNLTVPIVDLSKYLINHKVAFGNNSFEIAGRAGKYFGAILTIKEYHEIDSKFLDKILLIPEQMVITQTIVFMDPKKAKADFNYQNYILDISLDGEFKRLMGLKQIIESDKGSITDYGESQITIMVSSDTQNNLIRQIKRCTKALNELGFSVFREDLNMEDLFWSQLPGNFSYLRRKSPIPVSISGGFISLNNYPTGRAESVWGPAITLFRSNLGTPLFFSFHNSKNQGNTCIIGPDNEFDSMLLNFLVSESNHIDAKILFISSNNKSESMMKMMGAKINAPEFYLTSDIIEIPKLSLFNDLSKIKELLSIYMELKESSKDSKFILVLDELTEIITSKELLDIFVKIMISDRTNHIVLCRINSRKEFLDMEKIFQYFDTKFFTPDKRVGERKNLKELLSENSINTIKSLDLVSKQFFLKQDEDNIIAEFNITGITPMIEIITNNINSETMRLLEQL